MPTRPCWLEIDTTALEHNYRFLSKLAGPETECLAIVKADAYGHGLEICAPAAVRAGAGWLGVTSVEEGAAARAVCPSPRILIMGGIFPGQGPDVIAHRLTPVVWDQIQFGELENAVRAAGVKSLAVHLEIDTGMSRQGVSLDQLPSVIAHFASGSPLRIEAVMTHLYASDEAGGHKTAAQTERLQQAIREIESGLPTESQPGWLSVGASAALLGEDVRQLTGLAQRSGLRPMLRLGLALYGLAPHFDPAFAPGTEPPGLESGRRELTPVLTWKTRVVSLRDVPAGTEIGYNGTFVATEPMRLALTACGYADGLDRKLGNRLSLLVRGERAPLAGRISMDQAVIDVTEIPGVQPGDEVVILGRQGDQEVSAFDHAEAAGTIPWEVFTRIGRRVVRCAV